MRSHWALLVVEWAMPTIAVPMLLFSYLKFLVYLTREFLRSGRTREKAFVITRAPSECKTMRSERRITFELCRIWVPNANKQWRDFWRSTNQFFFLFQPDIMSAYTLLTSAEIDSLLA
jgi:hypothetical protein